MKVILTHSAEQDLENIGDHIACDAPFRALTFMRDLRDSCMNLADFPNRFPLIPRYEAIGIRRRVHGNYLILYRVEQHHVTVIRILHGAMDYAPMLFPS